MNFKIKHISLTILLLGMLSCGDKEKLPKGILTEGEMVQVISEIELTQALIKLKFSIPDTSTVDSMPINRQQFFNEVFDQFGISEEQFNKSLAHYCERPKVLEGLYTQVINELTIKQSDYQ